jgi:hypothetical protein
MHSPIKKVIPYNTAKTPNSFSKGRVRDRGEWGQEGSGGGRET